MLCQVHSSVYVVCSAEGDSLSALQILNLFVHHPTEFRKIIVLNTWELLAMFDTLCSDLHIGVHSHNNPPSSESRSACNDYCRKSQYNFFFKL